MNFELPDFDYAEPPEDFTYDQPTTCKVNGAVEQPGTRFFASWTVKQIGGSSLGIGVACGGRSYMSDHMEGRAWDWANLVNRPDDVTRVATMIEWLTKNNWENFKRTGMKYLIWNKQRWVRGTVEPYVGNFANGESKNPHQDHVHFSFAWPGARGETSFYRAAGFEGRVPRPIRVPLPTEPGPSAEPSSAAGTGNKALILTLSAVASYLGVRYAARRVR